MPFPDAEVHSWLNSWAAGAVHVQVHLGDPGAAGTSNPASLTARQSATFGAAASRQRANDVAVQFTSNTETYTWISYWSASSGGTFKGRAQLNAPAAMNSGDILLFNIGALILGPIT